MNGILKACRLEGNIPVVDAFNKVWHPLFGRCGVDIKHDGLYGFYQFTALIAFNVFGNEPETRDKLFALALVLVVREDGVWVSEETNATVPHAFAHGNFGQSHDRRVERKGYCARARGPYRARRCAIRARCKHFYVDGIGLYGVDEGAIGLLSANLCLLEKGAVDAHDVVVASKKARYIEEVHAFLGVSRHDGKGSHDGVGSALFQRKVYAVVLIGLLCANECAQKHGLGVAFLKVDGILIDHFTAEFAKTLGYASKARNGHKVTANKTVVHLKVPFIFDMPHGEKAFHHRSAIFHQLVVVGFLLLWLGFHVLSVRLLHLSRVGFRRLCGVFLHLYGKRHPRLSRIAQSQGSQKATNPVVYTHNCFVCFVYVHVTLGRTTCVARPISFYKDSAF